MLLILSGQNSYDSLRTAGFHPRVHTFSNVGLGGALHARIAGLATRIIDAAAYEGVNMRALLSQQVVERSGEGSRVLEIGCGVGTLSQELAGAGLDVVGAVDSSRWMIERARARVPGVPFSVVNAADAGQVFSDPGVDVAIACMLAHELPRGAHYELLGNMLEATRERAGSVWIVDIDPSYSPSAAMRSGEPFIDEYLATFEETAVDVAGDELELEIFSVIPSRVRAYVLTRRQ
ncbi:MAG: hypothetical protein CL862_01770 [Cyanobium sp. NAT70]|nr:hypothetical protein [Cyanobium sp. NAT70]